MLFPNMLFIIPVALFSHPWVLPHPFEISQGQRNTPELVVVAQGQLKVFSDPRQKSGVQIRLLDSMRQLRPIDVSV